VANHLYTKYDFSSIADQMDFVWIPKYTATKPVYRCDLWQYTSTGSVGGIGGNVDLSRVTGDGHTLEWFCGGE
jgi:GH25 family lysozyme M1 (1,4-beta-N-acetylmuramidase)